MFYIQVSSKNISYLLLLIQSLFIIFKLGIQFIHATTFDMRRLLVLVCTKKTLKKNKNLETKKNLMQKSSAKERIDLSAFLHVVKLRQVTEKVI